MTQSWLFPPASALLVPRERFVEDQNDGVFGHFQLTFTYCDLLDTFKPKGSMNHSFCTRFSLHCFIPPAMCSKISLSALCLHTEPVSDLKLKLHAFSFTNVPSLVESHVQLWMNSHNILAAVYLGFCSLCWLASTERQTKHSGGCQLMFFSLQHRLLN